MTNSSPISLNQLEDCFNACFLAENTQLKGGFAEPLYRPWEDGKPAEIQYREDYFRSALHEVAHWCVAGKKRRALEDFGYWYNPDGRNQVEQIEFYKVEIKPQAIEMAFCHALNIPFSVSCDNLNGACLPQKETEEFIQKVIEQFALYQSEGLPPRAQLFVEALAKAI